MKVQPADGQDESLPRAMTCQALRSLAMASPRSPLGSEHMDGEAAIVVDCLSRKLRGAVKVSAFDSPPQFARERVQVEDATDLLPLVSGTRELYLKLHLATFSSFLRVFYGFCRSSMCSIVFAKHIFRTGGDDADEIVARERRLVAAWLQEKLQAQFSRPIEVTSESASHHGKVLARFAGTEEPSKGWQRFYSTFHIDHKQNTALLEDGVQVNVWMNLSEEPISDYNLGFLARSGHMIKGQQLPNLTQEQLDEVTVRYQAGLRRDQALIFQSTGAAAVVHGCFRYQDVGRLTHAPRYSLEFRLLLRLRP